MKLRRGFKAEAEEYARDLRAELGLESHSPLCPWSLAEHLEIPVIPLSALREEIPTEVRYLSTVGRDFFSAVTLFFGIRRVILHNDGNSRTRQVSDLAHEIAHAILMHPPAPLFDNDGNRIVDRTMEAEAHWLGPTLLVPVDAALLIARSANDPSTSANEYGVSAQLLAMRLNVTGALKRAVRSNHQ